jgi:hypothetical protein
LRVLRLGVWFSVRFLLYRNCKRLREFEEIYISSQSYICDCELQGGKLLPHSGSYTRSLLVSQDRRHLFVTPLGSVKIVKIQTKNYVMISGWAFQALTYIRKSAWLTPESAWKWVGGQVDICVLDG